jgi:hypothetical protein
VTGLHGPEIGLPDAAFGSGILNRLATLASRPRQERRTGRLVPGGQVYRRARRTRPSGPQRGNAGVSGAGRHAPRWEDGKRSQRLGRLGRSIPQPGAERAT